MNGRAYDAINATLFLVDPTITTLERPSTITTHRKPIISMQLLEPSLVPTLSESLCL
jgi:hypothetical protein